MLRKHVRIGDTYRDSYLMSLLYGAPTQVPARLEFPILSLHLGLRQR